MTIDEGRNIMAIADTEAKITELNDRWKELVREAAKEEAREVAAEEAEEKVQAAREECAEEAKGEINSLRQALEEFGGHTGTCLQGALAGTQALHPLCTCGWNTVATEIERW